MLIYCLVLLPSGSRVNINSTKHVWIKSVRKKICIQLVTYKKC